MKKKIIFLVGPTAVGKTEVALHLAKRINAQIVSCDSMQIYQGMDIITSKPGLILRKKIPHHLLDVITPDKEYNVSRYRKAALKQIKEIARKGKTPLLVGGTGLYVSVLVDGIFKAKSQNENIRKRLYKETHAFGNAHIYARLKEADPEAAAKIHPNDTKRIIRALEVFETTGKPISVLQKERSGIASKYNVQIYCLNLERSKLYRRIEKRIDRMFAQGLAKEAKRLLRMKLSRTAQYAIGLKELKGYFEGKYDLEQAKELMKRNTRLYAKRQLTWFRKDKRIKWIEVGDKEKPKEIGDRIWKELY